MGTKRQAADVLAGQEAPPPKVNRESEDFKVKTPPPRTPRSRSHLKRVVTNKLQYPPPPVTKDDIDKPQDENDGSPKILYRHFGSENSINYHKYMQALSCEDFDDRTTIRAVLHGVALGRDDQRQLEDEAWLGVPMIRGMFSQKILASIQR